MIGKSPEPGHSGGRTPLAWQLQQTSTDLLSAITQVEYSLTYLLISGLRNGCGNASHSRPIKNPAVEVVGEIETISLKVADKYEAGK